MRSLCLHNIIFALFITGRKHTDASRIREVSVDPASRLAMQEYQIGHTLWSMPGYQVGINPFLSHHGAIADSRWIRT